MPSVCCYFQVHQPFRIRRFSYFDSSKEFDYFDDQANAQILRKVAQKCYLPTNELMLRMIEEHEGRFRIAYSISGVAIDQFAKYSPETLESFQKLAATGCVEFLGETYYHSLASIYSPTEFERQVKLHSQLMQRHFGVKPTVFRNTELIYDDAIGRAVSRMGYRGVIAEGADDILDWRSPNYVYKVAGGEASLLLKNYRLSDDVAFRFSNRDWSHYPLTADTFARWIHRVNGAGEVVNLFMDYETFGEHQWETTGIFEFMKHLPKEIFQHPDWNFRTPSEVVEEYDSVAELPFHRTTSWADVERDLTAWRGNSMQTKALSTVYGLEEAVELVDDPQVYDVWRKLQTSDHFYYMCTKWFADGDVHAYFSPFETPYDAFLNYENILKDFSNHLAAPKPRDYFEIPALPVQHQRELTSAA
ncbi:MAG: glycoside hydrolase family 57 protein [Candidatus Hydrogenedentota bacterium]